MDILAQVNYVNEKLKEGFSTVKIEKSLKLGKDTLRKRLNKNGYKYNRNLNQYILVAENLKKLSTNINKQKQTKTNINEQKQNNQLTEEEIKILRELIYNKNIENLISETYRSTTLQIEINLYKKLEQYCLKNKLTKKTVINQALFLFFK